MTLEEAIEMLRKEFAELPSDTFEFNMGYAAAIREMEHIAEDADNGKSVLETIHTIQR